MKKLKSFFEFIEGPVCQCIMNELIKKRMGDSEVSATPAINWGQHLKSSTRTEGGGSSPSTIKPVVYLASPFGFSSSTKAAILPLFMKNLEEVGCEVS